MDDIYFMRRAIELAKESSRVRRLLPPYVGSVVVRDGEVVGEGYKRFFSEAGILLLHAERDAINNAGKNSKDATLYTTLQPCVDMYKTVFRSCAELIVESGIKRVVIGLNPRDRLCTPAIGFMQKNGIEVVLFDGLQYELNLLRQHLQTVTVQTA